MNPIKVILESWGMLCMAFTLVIATIVHPTGALIFFSLFALLILCAYINKEKRTIQKYLQDLETEIKKYQKERPILFYWQVIGTILMLWFLVFLITR